MISKLAYAVIFLAAFSAAVPVLVDIKVYTLYPLIDVVSLTMYEKVRDEAVNVVPGSGGFDGEGHLSGRCANVD